MSRSEDCALKSLHDAVESKNLDLLESLLKGGADLNTVNDAGRTVLNFICYQVELSKIDLKIIQLLIQYGADVNTQDEDGNSPMMNLFLDESNDMRVRIESLKILLKNGADVTLVNHKSRTIFSNIILCNPSNPDTALAFEQLLKNGADPNMIVENAFNETALNFICNVSKFTRVHLKMIQILLNYKADVNIRDKDGFSPIMNLFRYADDYKFRLKACELLFENGADVTFADHEGHTILHGICFNYPEKNPIIFEVVGLLLKRVIDVNVRNEIGNSALQLAVGYGRDIRVIELFLKNGADPNIVDINCGWTALHFLCQQHKLTRFDLKIIQLLIQYEADVNIQNTDGYTPLMNLFRYAEDYKLRLKVCKLLLKNGADVTLINNEGDTVLHLIFKYNAEKNSIIFEAVESLLKSGVDVNKQNENGHSALHVAVDHCDNVKVIDLLLKNGANPNALDKDGLTALGYICKKPNSVDREMTCTKLKEVHLKMIKLLIQYKADLNVKNHQNSSPIMHLFEHTSHNNELILRMKIFELLVKNGTDLKNVDVFSKSMLLHRILICDYRGDLSKPLVKGLEFLLKNGADVNMKDNNGETVLHRAVNCKQTKHVAFLLKNGADPNIIDINGDIPLNYIFKHFDKYVDYDLHEADLKTYLELLKLNVKHNADPGHVGGDGKTALHSLIQKIRRRAPIVSYRDYEWVSKYGPQFVEILLKHGLDVNVKDGDGSTALNEAVSYCNYDMAKILVEHGADANTVQFKGGFLEKRWIKSINLPNFLAIIKLWQSKGFQINNHQYLMVFKLLTLHQDFEINDDFHSWLFELCDYSGILNRLSYWIGHIFALGSGSVIRKYVETLFLAINDSSTCTNFDSDKIKKTLYTKINRYLYLIEYGNMYIDIETYNCLRNKLNLLVSENPEIEEQRTYKGIRNVVDLAKKMIISNNISYLDLCTSSPDKTYSLLTKCDYYESAISLADFLFYEIGGIIRGYITKALVRRFIKQSTTDCIKLLFHGILPDLCCDEIIKFLDVIDLVSVFEAVVNYKC